MNIDFVLTLLNFSKALRKLDGNFENPGNGSGKITCQQCADGTQNYPSDSDR